MEHSEPDKAAVLYLEVASVHDVSDCSIRVFVIGSACLAEINLKCKYLLQEHFVNFVYHIITGNFRMV